MGVNFDGDGVTWPYEFPRTMPHVKCSKSLNSRAGLHTGENGGLPSNLNTNHLFEASSKKDVLSLTIYHI